uniref:DUF4352 domain-containing protein n=1 Tax=Siphoviridae sp. ctvok7 TaxID=2827596 RepID=A0A8S5LLC2_9CAUD|nr:MAG TPA: protein of unknown function DUF5067 [Siphoviridae sp. ctvok7]
MKKALCFMAAGVVALSLCSCSTNTPATSVGAQGGGAPSAQVSEPVQATPTPASTTTPTPEPTNLAIGDTAEIGDWSVSVTGFEFSTQINNGYGYFSPDDGNQYAVVSMSVTNNGSSMDTFWPSYSFGDDIKGIVIYDGQYEYSSVQLLAYDEDLHDESMNPLTTANGVIAFEVPEAVTSGSGTLVITISDGSASATFDLR